MAQQALSTTAERLDKDRVKLRVEVPESSLKPAIDAVYKRWAQEIKVPGFRKGKVPRALIDARVGPEAVREEALRDALPDFYREALASEDLQAIAAPDIEVVEFTQGEPLVFEATVDVRPEITLPELAKINVDAASSEVTDADVDEQIERLRERYGELETVSREARRGDYVLIDLNGTRHGQPVEGASAPDLLYEVGSRSGPSKLDDELEGNRAGAILKFTEDDISFTVLIKEVKAKNLPPLDDEFAKTAGFEALAELRDDLRTRLGDIKSALAAEETRSRAISALVDAVDFDTPEKLVEGEFEHRLAHFTDDLKRAGLDLAEYGRRVQMTELEIRSDIRRQAARSIKAELLLEEIARRQEFDVTSEDISREVAALAARTGRKPDELAKELVDSGRLRALAADVLSRKALDYVVEHVNVVGGGPDEA